MEFNPDPTKQAAEVLTGKKLPVKFQNGFPQNGSFSKPQNGLLLQRDQSRLLIDSFWF